MIRRYNQFQEDVTIEEIKIFLESSLNESISGKDLWESALKKIKNLSKESKIKIITWLILSTIGLSGLSNINNIIKSLSVSEEDKELIIEQTKKLQHYKPGYEFKLSQVGFDTIKDLEKLELTAYRLNDGRITVGWGHAEPINKSKFKVGEKITQEKAQELLQKDAKEAADGVRRIFKQWEEENIHVPITQSMFDALVSIAFNSGVGGLRKSKIIKELKKKNYEGAKKSIYTHNLGNYPKGLGKRRIKEASLFFNIL